MSDNEYSEHKKTWLLEISSHPNNLTYRLI